MTLERVPATEIEGLVGARRHSRFHLGRARSDEQQLYVLHSTECLATHEDLFECEYAVALARGIDVEAWSGREDQPVVVSIRGSDGRLVPTKYLPAIDGYGALSLVYTALLEGLIGWLTATRGHRDRARQVRVSVDRRRRARRRRGGRGR